jgi:hypothetical protein
MKLRLFFLLVFIALGSGVGRGAIIDFEDYPAGTFIRNQYLGGYGVRLEGRIVEPAQGTASGKRGLRADSSDNEFHPGPIVVHFDTAPQQLVRLKTGSANATKVPLNATLTAFDAAGKAVGAPATAAIPPGPTSINLPLEVLAPGAVIRRAELHFTSTGSGSLYFEALDDLEFDAVVAPPTDQTAPAITITSPAPSATLTQPFFPLAGGIVEPTALVDVRLKIRQQGALLADYQIDYSGTAPQFAFGGATLMGLLALGQNEITVEAVDVGGHTGQASVTVYYQPPSPPAPATLDITASGMEVTQGINRVFRSAAAGGAAPYIGTPLIAGRRTVVRVYGRVSGTTQTVPGVRCELRAMRGGHYLPESPLFSPEAIILTASQTVETQRSNVASTWNFVLPASWTTAGSLLLIAHVNPAQMIPECPSCYTLANEFWLLDVPFQEAPPLRVHPLLACIRRSASAAASVCDQPAAGLDTQILTAQNSIVPLGFPVADNDVLINLLANRVIQIDGELSLTGAPVTSTVMKNLLKQVEARAQQDTGGQGLPPNEVYLALVPPPVTAYDGLANVHGDGAVAKVDSASFVGDSGTVAEELGHSFGLSHAPADRDANGQVIDANCGNAAGEDLSYPHYPRPTGGFYPRASIGEWGIDTRTLALKDPSGTYDYMSYCRPEWFSPHTFKYLFAEFAPALPRPTALMSAAVRRQPGLLISGEVDERDTVLLDPFYEAEIEPRREDPPADGDLVLELRGRESVLFATALEPRRLSHADTPTWIFRQAVPFASDTREIVVRRGRSILARRLVSRTPPGVTLLEPGARASWIADAVQSIRWAAADEDRDPLEAAIHYSADDGLTWTTLATGVTGNEFLVDTRLLPGSAAARVRVRVTDGILTASAMSERALQVRDKPPVVALVSPRPGATYRLGDPIPLSVVATDLEDGPLPDEAITWRSHRDGELGHGRHLEVTQLTAGAQEITVVVRDRSGNVSHAAETVFVQAPDLRLELYGVGAQTQCASVPAQSLKLSWRAVPPAGGSVSAGPLVVSMPGEPDLVFGGPFPASATLVLPLAMATEGMVDLRLYAIAANGEAAQASASVRFDPCPVLSFGEADVDLGRRDLETGLANVLRQDGSDGENGAGRCGPDERESRANFGEADPTPDQADPFMYFRVTDETVHREPHLFVYATVYDGESRSTSTVALQYTNRRARSAADVPNVFFEHPTHHTLTGRGSWKALAWEITDAGFRGLMHHEADFRLVFSRSTCVDRVKVVPVISAPVRPPMLTVQQLGELVLLQWGTSGFGLQTAPAVDGVWVELPDAASPQWLAPTERSRFYRLKTR